MRKMTGQNSLSSKQFNRGLLLRLIATKAAKTRIELARMTGLTKMTVTNIVSEFLQEKLIVECEAEPNETCGRNPILLQLSEEAPKVLGLLIFRDRIEGVICSLDLKIQTKECIPFDDLSKQQLLEYCTMILDRLLKREPAPLALGVASIGPVDIRKGIISNPPRFFGIENVPIVSWLQERYNLPVFFDHDNNSAALAEKLFGMGKGREDFIFLGISNGIGSGIVNNGHLYHSHSGYSPEIGHVSINRRGLPCYCGSRGCLERYASTYVVLEKLRQATGLSLSFAEFCRLEGNEAAEAIWEEMLEDVSSALVSIVNVLQPELIVIGHDCIDWPQRYVTRLQQLVNERKMVRTADIPVRKAYFGKQAQLVGAAANAVAQVFRGDLLF